MQQTQRCCLILWTSINSIYHGEKASKEKQHLQSAFITCFSALCFFASCKKVKQVLFYVFLSFSQRVESTWNRPVHIMDKNPSLTSSGAFEWASEWVNERASVTSWTEQANGRMVRANEQDNKQMASPHVLILGRSEPEWITPTLSTLPFKGRNDLIWPLKEILIWMATFYHSTGSMIRIGRNVFFYSFSCAKKHIQVRAPPLGNRWTALTESFDGHSSYPAYHANHASTQKNR